MAIDPSIISSIGPSASGLSALADYFPNREKRQAEIEKARAAEAQVREQADLQRIVQSAPDETSAIATLRRIGTPTAIKFATDYQTSVLEGRTKLADAMGKEFTNEQTRYKRAAEIFQSMRSGGQSAYGPGRALAAQVLADDPEGQEVLAMLPPQWAPEAETLLDNLARAGLDQEAQAKRSQEALTTFLGTDKPGGFFGMLSTADSAEDAEAVKELARKLGGPGVDALIQSAGEWTPEAPARWAQMSMGPSKVAELAGQAEGRAETRRANQADEQVARGNLAVSQGNLSLRKLENQSGTPAANLTMGDQKLVEAVMKNPALYGRLTPTVATRIAAALSEKGFNFDAPAAKSGAAAKDGPNVGAILNHIETLSNKINTLPAGPMSTISGMVRRGAAGANMDNDVSEYNSLVEGMIPMIARAVGHTGVLTQQDVDSVRALFPKVGDNKTLAQNKIKRVRELMAGGAASPQTPTAPSGGQSVGRFQVVVE